MKKDRVLSRIYLGSYLIWIFGALLCPLLFIYASKAVAYVFLALTILDLACIIVSHVFYSKKRELFPLLSFCGIGVLNILVIIAFILQIVINVNNPGSDIYNSPYAWWVLGFSIAGLIPIDFFLIRRNLQLAKIGNFSIFPKRIETYKAYDAKVQKEDKKEEKPSKKE